MGDTSVCQVGQKDIVRINNLTLPVSLRGGAQWPTIANKPVEQPIAITLSIFHDISRTASTDELKHSINYSDLTDEVRKAILNRTFTCLQDLSRHISTSLPTFSVFKDVIDALEIRIKVSQPKAFLHCKTVAMEHTAKFSIKNSWTAEDVILVVEDLTCPVIIGVRDYERLETQNVVVNIELKTGIKGLDHNDWINVRDVLAALYKTLTASQFLTLEALTAKIASEILGFSTVSPLSPVVSVRAAKPSALPLAESSEISIVRALSKGSIHPVEPTAQHPKYSAIKTETKLSKVAIALGSNLGDSFQNIEYALRLLEIPQDLLGEDNTDAILFVTNTSFLYETAPMYVTDQASFINCACIVETNIRPVTLLRLLKHIEDILGRVPSIRNGPRAIDLDIVLYDDIVFDTRTNKDTLDNLEGELVIPHPRLQEREFVLRPLSDMIPDYIHPVLQRSVKELLQDVCDPTGPPMNKVIPFPRLPISDHKFNSILPAPKTLTHWTYVTDPLRRNSTGKARKSHVMATLNVTPDSFSDGSKHNAVPAALTYACSSVLQGATIIDVGGYSTRPGAAFVSVEEETNRVVPAITALRSFEKLKEVVGDEANTDLLARVVDTPISVDTFRWEVAEAAIKAGANCINDVYAFTGPNSWPIPEASTRQGETAAEYMTKLKEVARQYAVPVILMHSRGDAGKNKDYSEYEYAAKDGLETVEGVRVELGAKVDQIVLGKGGVRRWFVIADPGIGFSKTVKGNLEVLRSAKQVVADVEIGNRNGSKGIYRNPLTGYPQLIGVSRKSFLGAILAQEPEGRETQPNERTWATAAAVSCAVHQEALIVRVHDVKEMMDVVKVAEALWL
ncbi:Dihydropteroate synthase [Pholiota conissans]|uniref:Dihydropteroate synthase n=1 Tax=Pholiota conissans TaxID=109636 RepID=A0A9P6CYW0_9AGAR|nr:Dihydropteroate synthase [Pholiota conissans]